MTSDNPDALATLNHTFTGANFTNFFTAERYSSTVRHIDFSKGLIIASPSGFSPATN